MIGLKFMVEVLLLFNKNNNEWQSYISGTTCLLAPSRFPN